MTLGERVLVEQHSGRRLRHTSAVHSPTGWSAQQQPVRDTIEDYIINLVSEMVQMSPKQGGICAPLETCTPVPLEFSK